MKKTYSIPLSRVRPLGLERALLVTSNETLPVVPVNPGFSPSWDFGDGGEE